MKTRVFLSMGLSALVLGGTMVGCSASDGGTGIASASNRDDAFAAKAGMANARRAQAALAKRDGDGAVRFAEAAVGMMPQSADYRLLLAQGYLEAGRFTSARQGFADALALAPENGKAALNLALMQTAGGDWQAARLTLAQNAAIIPASDRGLALALAGDAQGAITLLTDVARSSESNAKVRQNLALSLALAGQWQAARVVAATDLAPADVDVRLAQWAAFAQPAAAHEQIAALLGVRAVADAGQPVALALNRAPLMAPMAPASGAAPVEALAAATTDESDDRRAFAAVGQDDATATPGVVAGFSKVTFAPRREVVQALPSRSPAMMLRDATPRLADRSTSVAPDTAASAVQAAAMRSAIPARSGDWYVQIGAYDTVGVAKDAWTRATRRFAAFAGQQPNGMTFRANGDAFYRLSVGGFSRGEADRLCRRYRTTGGACFVREGAGDQMAQWLRKGGMQVASR